MRPLTPEQKKRCEQLWPAARAFAKRRSRDPEIEGIAGLALVEALATFDPASGMDDLTWAKLYIQNQIRAYHKRQKYERQRGLAGGSAPRHDVPAPPRQTQHAVLANAISYLPPETAEIATMRFLRGWSERQIGQARGTGTRTISRQIQRAKKSLRRIIDARGEAALAQAVQPDEPTAEQHEKYATYLDACRNSVPYDAWSVGLPDVEDDVYRGLQREKYCGTRGHLP